MLPDSDGDGLLDGQEDPGECPGVTPLALTHPRRADTDGDGILDGIEVLFLQSNPLDPDDPLLPIDADLDGLPAHIDPDDTKADADGDRFTDAYELLMGSDPMNPDSIPTLGDIDGNGILNNVDSIRLFNYILSGATTTILLDRADVRSDGRINNVDAVALFNWILGTTPYIPLR